MSNDPNQFDDPALKQALRRAFGGETAPAALRQRVAELLARGEAGPAVAGRIRPAVWRRPIFAGIAAAVLVFLGGIVIHYASRPAGDPIGQPVLLAMVQTHDECCRDHPDHHMLTAPRDDLRQMGLQMSRELGVPVLAADLRRDGWTFRGASICQVGQRKAAHLMYSRGGQTLSVFSMTACDCHRHDGSCCMEEKEHPVAGFIRDGAVYAMVAHCAGRKLSKHDVLALLEGHKGEMVGALTSAPGPVR